MTELIISLALFFFFLSSRLSLLLRYAWLTIFHTFMFVVYDILLINSICL